MIDITQKIQEFKKKFHKTEKISIVVVLFLFFLLSNMVTAYAATFTPGMAKRDAPGPFAGGVMVQGDWSSSDANGDQIEVSSGTQINGKFRENFDVEQGTVVLWWTPEFSSGDFSTGRKGLFYITGPGGLMLTYSLSNNRLFFEINNQEFSRNLTVTAGITYLITVRWDSDNALDSTNYASIGVNDAHTFGRTSAPNIISTSSFYVGKSTGGGYGLGDTLIEGFTIYRRPLFDGTYGIDVGNGDEINQIYDAGAGKDPTLITGSWDVVFALPTNSSTGALTTGTGNAWSHPHSSNLLYTSTTNTGGFMMNGTYTSDGWATEPGLNNSLQAFWKLDETSGTREDSYGSNDLTDNNTVTQAIGKIGNAAQFTSVNTESLSITDNSELSVGDNDFTIAGWAYLDDTVAGQTLVSKYAGGGSREYLLEYNILGANRFNFTVSHDGSLNNRVGADSLGAASTGTWYFIVAWHDSSEDTINIQINNGAVDSKSHTTGVFDGSSAFKLGVWSTTGQPFKRKA
jgi:hypothetical protein